MITMIVCSISEYRYVTDLGIAVVHYNMEKKETGNSDKSMVANKIVNKILCVAIE